MVPAGFPARHADDSTEIYKCSESGKATYQDGLCASGPNKPLKARDAKKIEAPKGRTPEYVPPRGAPVAVIPHTPSKPLGNSHLKGGSTCRAANGGSCY